MSNTRIDMGSDVEYGVGDRSSGKDEAEEGIC